jgi:hypothetical protein
LRQTGSTAGSVSSRAWRGRSGPPAV